MKTEEQKYCQIVAIAAMFDNICSFMAAIISLQRFYKLECKTPKSMLTHAYLCLKKENLVGH